MALSHFKFINATPTTDLGSIETGMQSNTVAKAADVNAIFRQNSMIGVGLLTVINSPTAIAPQASPTGTFTDFTNSLNTSLKAYINSSILNYAGGTSISLNGDSKAGTTASFYAPTTVGTNGELLLSSGNGEPEWGRIEDILPTMERNANGIGRIATGTGLAVTYDENYPGLATISIGSGYKLLSNSEWSGLQSSINAKADKSALGTQVTYSIDTTTGVLTITTK